MKRLVLTILLACALRAADVTGAWDFAVELSMGSGTPLIVFKQDGNKLTGTYSGTLGEAPITGKIDGDRIEFSFEAEAAGQKFRATYKGVVKDAKTMQGTVDYGGIGDGKFTAKKRE
ncbi:MAG: hypothetical protein NZM29_05645 [Nitrospira sp.]|nr:hypothetical protein [Nitrospira sp.]